jgi:hypothetical protein
MQTSKLLVSNYTKAFTIYNLQEHLQRAFTKMMCNDTYSQIGYHFFTTRFKDFVFVIFKIQNINGINLNERYWIIQIMIIFMVVVVFHIRF